MRKRKKYLIVLLVILILLFLGLSAGGYALVCHERQEEKEIARLDKLADLKQAELDAVTPTPKLTATPTPEPTATPTPTPIVERVQLFDPDDFWNTWYSTNGRVTVNVYQIDKQSVGFSYHQVSDDGASSLDANVSAEIAGNAAELAFSDNWGNYAEGSLVFNGSEMYLKVKTVNAAGVSVSPKVSCVMLRYQPEVYTAPTEAPTPPTENLQESEPVQNGEYFFADSNSRYLSDEDMANYSSDELTLAKNEIYARHGRQFTTEYIASYFQGKSWYQGTIDPSTFDAQQDSIFNEYELANIQKIIEWEERKRSQGQ